MRGVKGIARCVPLDEGGELARGQLLDRERRHLEFGTRRKLDSCTDGSPHRHTRHVADVHLEVLRAAKDARVPQPELAARVLGGCAADIASFPRAAGGERPLEIRAGAPHAVDVGLANVVDVDVDREARDIQVDQIQRRPTFQDPRAAGEFVLVQTAQDATEAQHLFDDLRLGSLCQTRRRQLLRR